MVFFYVFREKSTFPVKKIFQNFFYILVNTNPTISPSFVGIGGFLFFGPFSTTAPNKVISFIFTLGVFGMSTIQRRVGANKINFKIPEALKKYSANNFMGGIDNMDKDKKIGGSFTSRALFRKWYRM